MPLTYRLNATMKHAFEALSAAMGAAPAVTAMTAVAAVAFSLLPAGPAYGQLADTPGARATSLPASADDEPELDEVRFTIGMAGSVSPTYSGSDKTGYAIAPAARFVWRGYSISTSSVARAS